MANDKVAPRKPYGKPKLIKHGDVVQLTQGCRCGELDGVGRRGGRVCINC